MERQPRLSTGEYLALPTSDSDNDDSERKAPDRSKSLEEIFKNMTKRQSRRGGDHVDMDSRKSRQVQPAVDMTNWTLSDYGNELLESMQFQLFMAFAIMANAVVIGFETDLPELHMWDMIEGLFLVVFTFELGLRLVLRGVSVFFNPEGDDFWWNCFDFAIVGLGIFDTATTKYQEAMSGGAHKGHSGGFTTLFRIIRLLRILRIFRIVRFLKQLYMLVFGFGVAAIATGWVTLLAIVMIYVCSIVLVRMVHASDPTDEDYAIYADRFGSVGMAMFSLFQLMLNPDLEPFKDSLTKYIFVGAFLFVFVLFGSFGMLALLTGVISEAMFEKNQVRLEEERGERESKRKILSDVCEDFYMELAKGEDEVALETILEMIPKMIEVFMKFGFAFTEYELQSVFQYTDTDDSGAISRKEFVHAVTSSSEGLGCATVMELHQSVLHQGIRADKRFTEFAFQLQAISDSIASFELQLGQSPIKEGSESQQKEQPQPLVQTAPSHIRSSDVHSEFVPTKSSKGSSSNGDTKSFFVGIDSMLALKIDACEAMVREMRHTTIEIARATRVLLRRAPTFAGKGQQESQPRSESRRSSDNSINGAPAPWDGLDFVAPLDVPEMWEKSATVITKNAGDHLGVVGASRRSRTHSPQRG